MVHRRMQVLLLLQQKKQRSNKTAFEVKATTGFRTPDFGKLDMMDGQPVI